MASWDGTQVSATTGGMAAPQATPYVLAASNQSGMGDTGGIDPYGGAAHWVPLSAIQQGGYTPIKGSTQSNFPLPAGGQAVQYLGDTQESSLGLAGPIFQNAAGQYLKADGSPITNLSPAQIQSALQGKAVAEQQSDAAQAKSLGSPAHLAELAGLAIGGAGALGYLGSGASAAGAGGLSGLGVTGPGYGAVLPSVSSAAANAAAAGLTGSAAEAAIGLGASAGGGALGVTGAGYGATLPAVSPAAASAANAGLTGTAAESAMGLGAGGLAGVSPTSGGMLQGAAGAGSSLLSGAGSSLLGALAAPIAGSLIGGALAQKPYSGPTPYQPTNQAGMDASFNQNYNTIQGLLPSYYGNIQPQSQSALNSVLNDPYAVKYQDAANNLASSGQTGYNNNTAMANSLNPANNANYQTLQGLLPSYYSQIQPRAQQSLDAVYNDPYAAQYQTAANNVAQQGQNVGNQDIGMANQIYQTAMDPQSALYARTLQQIQDQTRAANAAAGIGTSAAGVGLENQATGNFNIDWQNQQLNRQLSGAQGAGNISSQGMGILQNTYNLPYQASVNIPANQQAALAQYGQNAALYPAALSQQMQNQSQLSQMSGNVQNQGLGMLQSTYQAPYQASVAIPQNQQQAISQYASNVGAYPMALGNQMNQAANYMGMGQSAQNQAFNQGFQNSQAQNQQAANIGSGIGGAYSNYNNTQTMNNMINSLNANNQAYYGGGYSMTPTLG